MLCVCVSKLKTPPNSTFEMINLKSRNPWTLGLCRDLRHRYIHLLGNPCKFPLAKSNFRSCALGCLRFRHRDTQETTSAAVIRKRFSLSRWSWRNEDFPKIPMWKAAKNSQHNGFSHCKSTNILLISRFQPSRVNLLAIVFRHLKGQRLCISEQTRKTSFEPRKNPLTFHCTGYSIW